MKSYKVTDLFKTSWDQLSQRQFIAMLEFSEEQKRIEVGSQKYGFFIINVLRTLCKNKSVVAKLNVEQAVDCFKAIKFFRRKDKGFETPWYFFPVPDFTVSRIKFKRPALIDDMPCYYLRFGQLVYAESIFSTFSQLDFSFMKSPTPELMKEMLGAMNALAAVLYCSGPFDPGQIDRNARLVSYKLSPEQCLLIMHTYANFREYIIARCPNVFGSTPQAAEDDVPPGEATPPADTGEMWQNLLYDLAETEVFKGYQTAFNARAYDALDLIEKKAREAQERKTKPVHEQV